MALPEISLAVIRSISNIFDKSPLTVLKNDGLFIKYSTISSLVLIWAVFLKGLVIVFFKNLAPIGVDVLLRI